MFETKEEIFNEAKERRIPICIDTRELYYTCNSKTSADKNTGGYSVVMPKDDTYIHQMENILVGESIRARDARILSKNDVKEYSYFNTNLIELNN